MKVYHTGSPWSLAWSSHWLCVILPLGASIQPWRTDGVSPTTPSHSSSERSAKPSMSTWPKWWPAPPLLRDGVPYLTSSSRSGTSPIPCGALDGKHIACKCPPKSGSQYFNYKGFYSVVLMGIVDVDYKFIWADLGGKGSSDAQIYNNSEIKEFAENGTIGFPTPDALPNDYQDVPYFFIGDDVFALRETMMKPHSLRSLDNEERIFNYRLSRTRRVVENSFSILTNRFQVLLTTMQHHPSTVKVIVKACIVLHNLMRLRYLDSRTSISTVQRPWTVTSSLEHGDRTGTCKTDIQLLAETPPPIKRRSRGTSWNTGPTQVQGQFHGKTGSFRGRQHITTTGKEVVTVDVVIVVSS